MLNDDIRDYANRSVLCWLATMAKEMLVPSYRFNPDANEAAVRADAMISYGVKPRD